MSHQLAPPVSGRRSSVANSDRCSSQPPRSEHAGDTTSASGAPHTPAKVGGKVAVNPSTGFPVDAEEAQQQVKIIGPLSETTPRIAALGTLRAVGIGNAVNILETRGASQDSEVAAASRTTFKGVGHTKFLLCVAFSPDGSLVASGSGDQLVILWDVKTGARRSALIGHNGGVRCVAFSPDGLFLASASSDHNCILWDVLRGNQRAQLKGHAMEVNTVAFAPDSSFLFSGGVDKTIFVWDLRAPVVQLLTKLTGHTNHISAIAAAPDGHFLLSTGSDRQILVWDTRDFKQVEALTKHTREVHCVAFSVDGQYFATGGSDTLAIVWNASNFTEHTTLRGHTNRVMSVAFAPSGQLLATASMDKTIGLWDPVKGGGMKGQLREHGHQVYSVSFPRALGGPPILASGSFASNFILWDILRGRITATLEGGAGAENVQTVEWVQLKEASHRLLVRTTDLAGGQVLWDAESGRTTMLDRILEQEKKLREMDDMRVHQEKMVKLAKIRQQQEAEGKRGGRVPGAAGGDGEGVDDGGDAFGGGEGIAAGRMEQLMRELPDKIVHAMGHAASPSGPKKRLATALDAAAAGGGAAALVAHDGGSRHDADDRSQVSHGDHGEPGFGRGLSFGGGLGKDGGGSSHGGGGGTDTDVLLAAIAEVREGQRAQSRDVADLRKDVAQLQSTMAEILAALKQGGGGRR